MAPPTAPKKMAKKAAKKPPGNGTKGAKASFAKLRKAPAPKKKPEGWTDDQWQQDCLRRKMATAERKGRRTAEQEKKALAARQHQNIIAGCIAATNTSPWSTSLPVYVPGDALLHGGFNPNNLFYSPAYEQAPQREPGPGPDGAPSTGRRGPLEFDGARAEEEEDGGEDEEEEEEEGWRTTTTTTRTMTMTKRAARKRTKRVPVTMISWR
ncbi:hypothetical protein QYE76_039984 [Lolium multiflorum]|uniref:Uncharacterized protein n=1 Tax=Lolium multiflorum TaxID=4521 RepID=A0AAD8TCK8_LOLMU|nr:hypothetical protein QYE76_039984 [Lolium multiflorum]